MGGFMSAENRAKDFLRTFIAMLLIEQKKINLNLN